MDIFAKILAASIYLPLQYFISILYFALVEAAVRAINRRKHIDKGCCFAIAIPLGFMAFVAAQACLLYFGTNVPAFYALLTAVVLVCIDCGVNYFFLWRSTRRDLQRETKDLVPEEMVEGYIRSTGKDTKSFLAEYDKEKKQKAFVAAIDRYAEKSFIAPKRFYSAVLSAVKDMIDDGRL